MTTTLTLLRHPPKQIVAGDSIEFLLPIPQDLTSWTGSARLTGGTDASNLSQMDATSATTEGLDLHVLFQGQVTGGTKSLKPGQYTLTAWMTSTDGKDRYTIGQYFLAVTPDLSTGTPALAHAMKTLAIVEAAIEVRLGANTDSGIEEYTVEGTMVKKIPIERLYQLRKHYAAEVNRLQDPHRPLGSVNVVFTTAGEPMPHRRRYYPGSP